MTRHDPELGVVRRCSTCREWWPDEADFYGTIRSRGNMSRRATCNACRADRRNGRAIPLRPTTHGVLDLETKRRRDCERKAALRRDPVLGDKLRERQAAAAKRYYERNRAACLERNRSRYAARLDRSVREGFGRPRVAA